MRIFILILSLFIFTCDNEPECASGEFDECGVCDGPGKIPENEDDCEYVTQCGYVTVSLGVNDRYCYSAFYSGCSANYQPCYSNSDCVVNNGFASDCSIPCKTTTEDYVCEDVYECNTSTTYVCP